MSFLLINAFINKDIVVARQWHRNKQEAQLSQRDRATLLVIEYFAKSLKVTQGHSKRHRWVERA